MNQRAQHTHSRKISSLAGSCSGVKLQPRRRSVDLSRRMGKDVPSAANLWREMLRLLKLMSVGNQSTLKAFLERQITLIFIFPFLVWVLSQLVVPALAAQGQADQGRSAFTDNFAGDTSLNGSLWTTQSNLLNRVASFGEGGGQCFSLGNSFVSPVLKFGPKGMEMTGTSGWQQFTGIQSLKAFSPPFEFRTTVTATVANGNPFEIFLVSTDGRGWFSLYGNVNPSNQPYTGIDLGCGLFYRHPAVGEPYTIDISVSAAGLFSVSLFSGSTTLARRSVQVGTGPFYLVLGQGEGWPNTGGTENVAYWRSVTVESGSIAATAPAVKLYAPVTSGTTVSLNGVARATTLGATITKITWNWGDGTPPVVGSFPETHIYAQPGNYNITVTATDSNNLVTSASATAEIKSSSATPLEVVSITAVAQAASYAVVFPPKTSLCGSGSSLSDQTKATPTYCPPTIDYIQLAGPAVPVEGRMLTIQVTFTNNSANSQQAPACISVNPESSGSASWWTFPATSDVTAPPASAEFTAARACADGSSANEASLIGSGTVGGDNTMTITYRGMPTWNSFALESEVGWISVKEAVDTSLGVADKTTSAVDALGELPEELATTSQVLGVASVAAEAANFASGLIDLGAVQSIPWVSYQVQVQGGSPTTFQVYAQPEKMAIFDALLWDLKWRMIPLVGSAPGLATYTLDGLQNIFLGKDDCVYSIVSEGEPEGPPYLWFYNELENVGGDEIPSSKTFHLSSYVNLGACTWTGLE